MNDFGTIESQGGILKDSYPEDSVSRALSERLKNKKEKKDESEREINNLN